MLGSPISSKSCNEAKAITPIHTNVMKQKRYLFKKYYMVFSRIQVEDILKTMDGREECTDNFTSQ